MTERPDDPMAEPLPREWLPDAQPADHSPVWDARAERILARVGAGPDWWAVMGMWWKPAAALAAAAAVLLFVTVRRPAPGDGASLSLAAAAAAGDPALLWSALDVRADPVLALIAAQEPRALPVPSSREEEPR